VDVAVLRRRRIFGVSFCNLSEFVLGCHATRNAEFRDQVFSFLFNLRVEIFARVLKKGVKTRLVMVGDGSERQNCEHRARCLGIYEHCTFVGKQPRIVDYLSASDVLLLPSEQESFGLAALEAMACEVPVIASRVGGLPEVVTDGETGYLSPVGDIGKMAGDAARLLVDHKLRREMGQRARESAITRYRTDVVIPQYIEFYEKILAKGDVGTS